MENRANSLKSVDASKNTSKGTEGSFSVRWDDFMNRAFIGFCMDEIGKGNRPSGHFNHNGWNNILKKINEMTGRSLSHKQLRNHWDAMKKEWLLFKKLIHGETGMGWNPSKNSIDATDEWWSTKINENVDYKKFKNKDLSLIWFEYHRLFSDVATTGEKAQAPSQRRENEIDIENKSLEVNDETNEVEEQAEVGDSDDIGNISMSENDVCRESLETSGIAEKIMFPSLDSLKRKYCGETSSKRKKMSGSASLKEDIHSPVQFMEKKTNATSMPSTEITIMDAMNMLNKVLGISPVSELWNYACNLLSKKDMREVFASQPSHEARISWLKFNYDLFKRSRACSESNFS